MFLSSCFVVPFLKGRLLYLNISNFASAPCAYTHIYTLAYTHTRIHIHLIIYTHVHTDRKIGTNIQTPPLKHTHIYAWIISSMNNSSSVRRCPWCNGYRCRKWTRRHELKSWTRLIAFHIALIPLGKVWIQLFSL